MAQWLTDLVDILEDANVPVIGEKYTSGQYTGKTWRSVGWKGMGYYPGLQYILWHHDASPEGPSEGALHWIKTMPIGPAGGVWVCMGCNGKHASGTWHVTAAGAHNHAGSGGPWSPDNGAPYVPQNGMNYRSLGIEVDHTYGESWRGSTKMDQLMSLRRGTAAICKAYGLDPKTRLLFHKTWTDGMIDGVPRLGTVGRKNDIYGLDLPYERGLVAKLMERIGVNQKKVSYLKRRIRSWRNKRDKIRASGKTAGLPTARKRIRSLHAKLKAVLQGGSTRS